MHKDNASTRVPGEPGHQMEGASTDFDVPVGHDPKAGKRAHSSRERYEVNNTNDLEPTNCPSV